MQCLGFKGGIGTASRRTRGSGGRIYRRRAGPVQLRPAPPAADSGSSGGPGDHRSRKPVTTHDAPLDTDRRSSAVPPGHDKANGSTGRSSSSSRRTRRCSRTSSGDWPGGPLWGSAAWAGSPARVREICSWPSRPPRPGARTDRGELGANAVGREDDPVYEATVQATEEAIINALLAATTMTGANYLRVPALPHDRLRSVLEKYGRLQTERFT